MSDPQAWSEVDDWFDQRLLAADDPDGALAAALRASEAAGLPSIAVSPSQGKLLALLATSIAARRILEVGTLGGYSSIWLARAIPPDGRLVTCELDPHHAEVARANLDRAGVGDRVEILQGRAVDSLRELVEQRRAGDLDPFDLVFIDADKASNADYLAAAMDLVRPGALVVVDNVVRQGRIVTAAQDADVVGVRRVVDAIRNDPRLSATVIQTVGAKGWDGMILARVADAD